MAKARQTEIMVSAIRELVSRKTDAIRSQMNGIINHYQKIVKRLNGVIFTLELYPPFIIHVVMCWAGYQH